MFNYFWSRNASVGMAVLYIALGLPLVLFPAAVGTAFVWALAIGCVVYAVPHLIRYLQGRKVGQSFGGDLFLTVLPLFFALFALFRPHVILSFLPFVLGALLLMDGVGKLPLMLASIRTTPPAWPSASSPPWCPSLWAWYSSSTPSRPPRWSSWSLASASLWTASATSSPLCPPVTPDTWRSLS